jgi:uncharacterized protein (DUF952 family)
MRRIYHLTTRQTWENARGGPYRAASLASEGFIHCSNADQAARSANRFYADAAELLALCLDADRLGPLLKDEPAKNGELFPHLYGPIPPEAVIEVRPLRRGTDGRWVFES